MPLARCGWEVAEVAGEADAARGDAHPGGNRPPSQAGAGDLGPAPRVADLHRFVCTLNRIV